MVKLLFNKIFDIHSFQFNEPYFRLVDLKIIINKLPKFPTAAGNKLKIISQFAQLCITCCYS